CPNCQKSMQVKDVDNPITCGKCGYRWTLPKANVKMADIRSSPIRHHDLSEDLKEYMIRYQNQEMTKYELARRFWAKYPDALPARQGFGQCKPYVAPYGPISPD